MENDDQVLIDDLKDGIKHGIRVCNLARLVAAELGIESTEAHDIAVGGLLHDIGKLGLSKYLYGRNKEGLNVEEIKYMRMHPKLSYDIISNYNFSETTLDTVLFHHENYDGTGYPANLKGDEIPIGARVLRVVDTFIALISVRPYRAAFDPKSAVEIMIDEIKNYDMEIFIAFQRVINNQNIEFVIDDNVLEDDGFNEQLVRMVTKSNLARE